MRGAPKWNYIQLSMPVRNQNVFAHVKTATDINTGEHVVYRGSVSGGPTNGTKGVVRRKYAKKAIVDLGNFGIWNVPYFLLSSSLTG